MTTAFTRRSFLGRAAVTGALAGLGELGFLSRLPSVSAAEAKLNPNLVRFGPDIEPLVRLLEETPRERLLEEVAARIRRGLSYRETLTALLLAAVRNVQPRPLGFKFHAVLVINAAHLASLSSPESDRWLPIFWALDHFKDSQARNLNEGAWTMSRVEEAAVPPAHKAAKAFHDAMDNWDESAADAAVTALARSAGSQEIFETFCRYGARDFRAIGHKAIYVANSWRTLECIGWQHAEPVLRSLAYGLLEHEGENPAKRDAPPDRPFRRNVELVDKFRPDWLTGRVDVAATGEMLDTVRHGSSEQASDKALELINRGVAAQSIWDAHFSGATELLMRRPGIVSLHAVTATNAFHFAFENNGHDATRRLLLLQNAAYLPLYRGDILKGVQVDRFEPIALEAPGTGAIDEIFAEVSRDRLVAAGKMLSYLQNNQDPATVIGAARRLVFLKGQDAHDYKFSSAVLEDYYHASPAWRHRFLAASVFNLRGSGSADNELVKRTRAALGA